MDGLVHRPVPRRAARCYQLISIGHRLSQSITTYTSMVKVQVLNLTIYEMGSSLLSQKYIA
jgi:hypothetical protein